MNDKQHELAEVLDEYSTFLEIDGQDGRAYAYDKAARSIRRANYLPPDPAEIDGIGDSIRTTIARWQRSGEIAELEQLKEEYSYYNELQHVDNIGPSRAKQINEKLSVEDVDDLLLVGDDLTLVDGIGPKTADKILSSAREQS